jgi:protein gp37
MSQRTSIEWTQSTWNPVTGCTKVSTGCANCYAHAFAERFRGVPGHPYSQGFDLKLWPDRLDLPLRWNRPRVIFVNSMSDLFHPDVPEDFIQAIFQIMQRCPQHTFQILTKRPQRAAGLSPRLQWPRNVWLGTSVETQRYGFRLDSLRRTEAQIRFVSCEPLLGPLRLDLTAIDWVIVGGESGPRARPMRLDWVRSVRSQCDSARVPFFFKQWGAFNENGTRVGKARAGRLLDGRTWDDTPHSAAQPVLL